MKPEFRQKQGVFHDARYQGLYGMRLRDVKRKKGLGLKEQNLCGPAPWNYRPMTIQMNLAAEVIWENILGEAKAIERNKAVAADVRRVIT